MEEEIKCTETERKCANQMNMMKIRDLNHFFHVHSAVDILYVELHLN